MEKTINTKTIKKEKDLEIASRINKRMHELNIEQKDLLKKFSFEVSQGTLAKWLSLNPKINNGIKPDIVKEFSQILETSTEYLLYGAKDKKQTKNLPSFITKIHIKNGCVGAGSSGLLQEEDIIKELYVDTNQIARKFRDSKIHGIQVLGDSMSPYVNQGDIEIENLIVGSSSGGDSSIISATPPLNPKSGDVWIDDFIRYTYQYNKWIEI